MGRREEMVKLAESLMADQESIRNIGTVAHIDHGKCVTADTRLMLSDGQIVTAKELFETLSKESVIAKETKQEIVFDVSQKNFVVFSLNKETGCIEKKPIQFAWKLAGGKTVKIKLRNGLLVETTPEHKYITFNGIEFVEKEAKEISAEDIIVCPREIKTDSLLDFKTEFLKRIAAKPTYAIISNELNQKIGDELYSIESISSGAFKENLKHRRYKIETLLKILPEIGISETDLYEQIELIFYRQGGKTSKNAKAMKLPKNIQNFYYLAGLLFGDGTKAKLVVGKPKLGERFEAICQEIGIKPFKRNYEGKTPEIAAGSKTLLEALNAVFDYPLRKKSKNVFINRFLQQSPQSCISAFLQAYFDCDGTVEESRRAISITSASPRMIIDLQLLLVRFGCLSTIDYNTVSITGFSAKNFVEKIGFGLAEKQKKALGLAERITGSQTLDLVPINQAAFEALRKNVSMSSISHHYYKYEKGTYKPTLQTFAALAEQMAQKGIDTNKLQKINLEELAFIQVKDVSESFAETVYDFTIPDNHNFAAEGMFIHNTTLSDSLIAEAGLISFDSSGVAQVMDYEDQEQERGITINAANITIVYEHEDKKTLINLIDTPGHVDFTGEVIRAMRAVDGVIVVVDAVEGIMPQTETVIRQALREYVKPTLFINKVDRLISELKVSEEEMQKRFVKVIAQVNGLISKNVPEQFKKEWLVDAAKGSVAFGSAKRKWAVSVPYMQKNGINFKKVYEYLKSEQQDELAKVSPVSKVVLQMVETFLPSPKQAQQYRIKRIWGGEMDLPIGKSMQHCDPNGELAMMITDVSVDKHAGDIATGRVYSGTVEPGMTIRLVGKQQDVRVQKVGIFMGNEFVDVNAIGAGNIAALVGLKDVYAGETIGSQVIKEFESFMSAVEPVITVSIEAKQTKDLPKLINALKQLTKEDPNLRATINQETGEHLLSGMGELHLDVNRYRIETNHKVPVNMGNPIVVYKETMTKKSLSLEGKTPNRHNKFSMHAEPIPKELLEKLIDLKIDAKIRDKDKELVQKLIEIGFPRDEARKIWAIHNNCVLVDGTRGIQSLFEVKELVIQGFQDAVDQGPLGKEKCFGVKIVLEDATLHEDSIHRGPAQVLPAIVRTIYACMLNGEPLLFEPKQLLSITVPHDYMGAASKELGSRRTQISEVRTEGDTTIIVAKAPVKELIGFSSAIRGATQGRAQWTAEYAGYEPLPRELQKEVITEIRKRKGMDPEVKNYAFFLE